MAMTEKDDTKSKALLDFKEHLRGSGLKFSQARLSIFNEVFVMRHHFNASELVEKLKEGRKRVSRGTVYRTLGLLETAGIVRKIYEGERHLHYERVWGVAHYDHLLCESCGKVLKFFKKEIAKAMETVCAESGFEPRTHTIQILGLCSECGKDAHGLKGGTDHRDSRG